MGSSYKNLSCLQKFPKSTFCALFKMFWPLCLSLLVRRLGDPINVAFAARGVGTASMGAVGISNGLLTVTANGLGSGLAVSFETMAAKAYGAKNFTTVGVLLQKAFIFAGFLSFVISALWIHMGAILQSIGIPSEVAYDVEMFLVFFIPTLLLILAFRLLRAYLIIQNKILPSCAAIVVIVVFLTPFNYFFVYVVKLKIKGIAVSNDLSYFFGVVLLFVYIIFRGLYKETWSGFTKRCLLDWGKYLMLSLPVAFSVLLKYSIHEVALIAVGTIGIVEVAAQTVFFTLIKALLTITNAVAMTININISLSLGEKDPAEAKKMIFVGNLFNLFTALSLALLTVALKDYIGMIFTPDVEVQQLIAKVTPYVALSFVLESLTTIFFFICIGLRLQFHSTIIYVITSYLIGLPLGIVLAIHWKDISLLWCGLATGFFVQFMMFLALFYWKVDIDSISEKLKERSPLQKNNRNSTKSSPNSTKKRTEDNKRAKSPKDMEKEEEKQLLEEGDGNNKFGEEVKRHLLVRRLLILSIAVLVLVISIILRLTLHV